MNVVVGGGWSGLAAAVELTARGLPVTLIEAAGALGGRARSVDYRGGTFDNGQHVLIGAYDAVRYLQRVIGLDEADMFERRLLDLRVRSRHYPDFRLRPPALPAPLHLLAGLLTCSGLGLSDRLRALRLCLALRREPDGADCSVAEWLARYRQSPRMIACLWQPLCLATLNTPLEQASAEVFVHLLRNAFGRRRGDSDLLIPRRGLGALLPEPAGRFIADRGGNVLLNRRVVGLEIEGRLASAVVLADDTRLPVQRLILAMPPAATARLLSTVPVMARLAADLERFETLPICTVYLQYAATTALDVPMIGFEAATAQWLFDLRISGQPGLMSVVVSGPGAHMQLDNASLIKRITGELASFYPDWPAPQSGFVLREKHATFACRVGINALRPGTDTPLPNCRLAGDTVMTGYPSTLEGAARSGLAAARSLVKGVSTL